MRIGIDARMYSTNFTGIGRYVAELIDGLLKLDTKNEYVLFMNNPEYDAYEVPAKRVKKVLVNAPYYSFAEQTRFLRAIKKSKVDFMHFTHFNAPILYKGKSLVTIHDLTLSFFPGKKMNSAFHRMAYKWVLNSSVKTAEKIIAVSQNTKKDLQDITATESSKIEVIYEGVSDEFTPREDHEAIVDLAQKYLISKDFLLYTGVWRGHKNLVNLIRAFSQLKADESFDGLLVITGKEDPYYPDVKRSVKELGLEQDVIFTGHVDSEELVALYQSAKLYVFPSLYEGFGLPPLEAMRSGTAVVASKSSCIPEICGEENAYFFDPYDSEDMAQSILRVWLDDEMRKDYREKGLKHSRKFRWDKMAEKTFEIYKEILSM